jgi:hypothetical protein
MIHTILPSRYAYLTAEILLVLCMNAVLSSNSSAAEYPALPRFYIHTPYNPPVGGKTISVNTSAAFQAALNSAQPGDIIELEAGATFTGPFTLPNKTSGTEWIYIRSSKYSSLPAPCSRVNPADAANMPKIVVTSGNGGTINTATNAHHYRFVGIEFTPLAGKFVYNIIQIGNTEKTLESLPNNIVFDRCYIHGDPAAGSRRGVMMNGAYISVIDSYVSDCKEAGADSQALGAWSTPGPIKIVNNYLEGAGENVMFGGSDPNIVDCVPSDIEIRCNLIFKPLSWMGTSWTVKNQLEFKNARRVLVEGNRFENNWPNGQSGFAVLLTPRNQNNTAPWSAVQDITIRLNTFINIAQGINMSGYDAPNISQRTSRVLIQNNVLNVTNLGSGGDGRMFQVLNGLTDVIFDHNTGFCTNAYMVSDGSPKTDYFVFQNNIVSFAAYGFIGTGTANANTTLARYFNPNWAITNNAVIGGTPANYPAGSYFPANIAATGFANYAGGDYHLTASSPYKNLGTDGKDLGADIDSISLATTYVCDGSTGIDDVRSPQLRCVVFPDPGDALLHVHTSLPDGNAAQIIICNLFGREVFSKRSSSGAELINTSAFPNGIYVLKVLSQEKAAVRKIIIRH